MNEQIIAEVLDSLVKDSPKIENQMIDFKHKGYETCILSNDNYHEIKKGDGQGKAAFIDGGNTGIVDAPDFSLQFMRLYTVFYENNTRISSEKHESFVLVKLKKNNELFAEVKVFPLNNTPLFFDAKLMLDDLGVSLEKNSVASIANMYRDLVELKLCKEASKSARFVVRDGSLFAVNTLQEKALNELITEAEKNSCTLAGLSKTSRLLTEDAVSVIAILSSQCPKHECYYHPLIKPVNSKVDMMIARLNKNSDYLFRLDFVGEQKELLALLCMNSKDISFPGYPYGLIDADNNARVSNKDKLYFHTLLSTKAGSQWEKIRKHSNCLNAHSILDMMSF